MPLQIDTVTQHVTGSGTAITRHRVSPHHLVVQTATLSEPVEGSVLRVTPNYHGTVPVEYRPAIGAWNPTTRSVCSMLHAADIRGRWEAVVLARLRKHKKRYKSNARSERKYAQ